MRMKILFCSNAPFVASGYGNQTDLFTRRLKAAGHQVVVVGTFGHHGATMHAGGISILPAGLEQYGNDVLEADIDALKPDVAVLLYDAWVMRPQIMRHLTAWSPVDHQPMPPLVRERLSVAKHTWAMSRFGEREMRKAGLDPYYVPHGVDTGAFHPTDRSEARAVWGVSADTFLAVMVGANKGTPARKGFDRVFKAWAQFVEKCPQSLLYIHAHANEVHGGLDLIECSQFYGVPEANLKLADPYGLARSRYGTATMNALYNAADVLLAPSMGEGFGIPVIEAQAAGCPVVVSDFTAQSELAGPGYKVPIHDDDRVWTAYGSEWCLPRPSEILKGIDWAFEQRGNKWLRAASLAFALDYDADRVFEQYLHPAVLSCGGQALPEAKAGGETIAVISPGNPASRPVRDACANGHDWAQVGVWDEAKVGPSSAAVRVLCVPCKRPGCPAELAVLPGLPSDAEGGRRVVRETGFEMAINGVALDIEDDPQSAVAKIVCREAGSSYRLDEIEFAPGDVVLDVGAHVGVISIYLARTHPDIRIIAYEPMPDNFARLQRNLQSNGVTTVEAVNMAVTGTGGRVELARAEGNSGGHSAYTHANGNGVGVPSRTLAQVLEAHGVERVALLKIDCEGAEYEILTSSTAPLGLIERIRGELHTNARLRAEGHDPAELLALLAAAGIEAEAHVCPIAE